MKLLFENWRQYLNENINDIIRAVGISKRMFDIDSTLSYEGANINHNLADFFSRFSSPRRVERLLPHYDPDLWIPRWKTITKFDPNYDSDLYNAVEQLLYDLKRLKDEAPI